MLTDTLIADKIRVFVTVSVDVACLSVNLVYIIWDLIVNNVINNVTAFYGIILWVIHWLLCYSNYGSCLHCINCSIG